MTDDESSLPRRRVLQAIGAGGMAGLAGCNGDGPATDTVDLDTPTDGLDTPTDAQGGRCPDVEYVLNTGYDQDAGSTITPCNPDDDWEVTDEQVSAGPLGRAADVIEPHPAWASPFQDSRWISVTCDGNPGLSGNEELFEFTYCFCLNEGFRNPELEIELRADDAVDDIRLNGTSLTFSGTGTYAGTPVEVTTTSRRHFQAGENCLTVVIRDTGSVITGLNLAGTVTAENGECCEGTCDLGIEKTHEGPFEFGGTGTYVIEVCNRGDGICNEAAEVRDELPPGVTFDSASGQGWNVTQSGGTINATHPNQGGLDPGECLPPLEIDVGVAPFEEFPAEGALENCAELVTGGQHADNDRDCTTPCVAGERTFEGGVRDGFDATTSEPASPSQGLQANWGGNLRDFDEGGVNAHFGHTYRDLRPSPVVGEICEASLEICLRPEGSSLNTNDIISLGVWEDDGTRVGTSWGRKIGSHGDDPGLFDTTWHPSETDARCITLDLSELPEKDGSTTDLLPLLNTYNRVSIHVQDDTAVDFAHLSVTYCCDGGPGGECDLSVEKSVQDEFQFGERGRYLVEVCNDGDGDCERPVTVTDRLPDGIAFVGSAGSGWQCEQQGGEVRCEHDNAGGLSPGECLPPLTLEVEVAPVGEWPGGDRVENCVVLQHGRRQVDEDCVQHPVTGGGGECRLAIDKSAEGDFPFGGEDAYAIQVCNRGQAECIDPVSVTDLLPDGISFVAASGTGWTCDAAAGEVVCRHPNDAGLAPGECLPTLRLRVQVASESEWPGGDTAQNCVQLRSGGALVTERCIEHPVGGATGCQLSIGKRVEDPFEFGGAGAYGFRVCNEGDEVCEQEVVEVVDELPQGFEFIGGGGTGWSCELVDPDRNLVSCTYEGAVLEPGECLPRNVWEIEVVPEDEWPHDTNTVQNCAQLSTAQERVDEDCVEHTVE